MYTEWSFYQWYAQAVPHYSFKLKYFNQYNALFISLTFNTWVYGIIFDPLKSQKRSERLRILIS